MGSAMDSGSPEVVEMRAAVRTLNAAEERMVRELPGAGPREATLLATEVHLARREFDRAFDDLSAALNHERASE